MTLKNIQLPAAVIVSLFKYSLSELRPATNKTVAGTPRPVFSHSSNKPLILLAAEAEANHLPGDQVLFLKEIFSGCKLPLDNIGLINVSKAGMQDYKDIPDNLDTRIIILFGLEVSLLALPFKIPPFQIQVYKEKKYVQLPSIATLQNDAAVKGKMEELLKILL